jgi:hypothetical protein
MIKTYKLYNDTVTLHFNNVARNRYVIEETKLSPVGVTTILGTLNKPALMTWPLNEAIKKLTPKIGKVLTEDDLALAKKAYLDKSDKGKDTGALIHSAIESYLRGKKLVLDESIVAPIEAFKKWFKESKAKVLGLEQTVYSRDYNYCGTFDAILEIDGQIVLVDWKSTNISYSAPRGIYAENFYQLGAYNFAYREEKATRTDKTKDFAKQFATDLMVVRVGKEGVIHTLRASELGLTVSDCEQVFMNLLMVYRHMTPLIKTIGELK